MSDYEILIDNIENIYKKNICCVLLVKLPKIRFISKNTKSKPSL